LENEVAKNEPVQLPANKVIEAIKLDFNTIRLILLTALVVVVLLGTPLFFILSNFVTFDSLDRYFKLTDSVRPKILHNITEELQSGYSKNFIINSPVSDTSMLFYANISHKVNLSVNADAIGTFPRLQLLLDNCAIYDTKTAKTLHMYEFDLTQGLKSCPPTEPNLHTLRIALLEPLQRGTTLNVSCLVLVSERIREHLEETNKK
jgi:hypothetical protein